MEFREIRRAVNLRLERLYRITKSIPAVHTVAKIYRVYIFRSILRYIRINIQTIYNRAINRYRRLSEALQTFSLGESQALGYITYVALSLSRVYVYIHCTRRI